MAGNGVKMAKPAELFKETLKNVFEVLQSADKQGVFTTQIPAKFLEKKPLQITETYNQLLVSKPDVPLTTIADKFKAHTYKSPYQFYHDVKLASYIQINQLEIGAPEYVEVDRFYKFSTELFLRECYRCKISIDELKSARDILEENHDETGFEEMLSDDFDSISTSYNVSHSEAYVVLTQNNVPLFTSLNERSSLDEREVILPEPVQATKVLPTTTTTYSTPLGDLSPHITRMPQLNSAQGDLLSRFLHPNWYSLPTAKWLETSDLQSFAPSIDEQTFVVSSTEKGRLWLENIGYKKLQRWRKEAGFTDVEMNDVSKDTGAESESATTKDTTEDKKEVEEPKKEETTKQEEDDDDASGELTKEDFMNLYEWSPQNYIDDEEIEAFENCTEQEYLSEQLAQLQKLRDERYAKGIKIPTKAEEDVYYKCLRLLKEIIYVQDTVPGVKPSTLMPVEQFIYPGTLPVPQQNPNVPKRKYKTRTR